MKTLTAFLSFFLFFLFFTPFRTLHAQSLSGDKDLMEARLRAIYKDLLKTIGDKSDSIPTLRINKDHFRIASLLKDDSGSVIYIDALAIAICQKKFKDRAVQDGLLAFLIAHELSHFYNGDLNENFIDCVTEFDQRQIREKEEKADEFAAYIVYQAGYDALQYVTSFVEELYRRYRPLDLSCSLPAEDRGQLAKSGIKRSENLIALNKAAHYLFVAGHYGKALPIYEYLLSMIKFKEIYNNLGAIHLYGHTNATTDTFTYCYPMPIALEFPRQRDGTERNYFSISKAIQYLRQGLQYDQDNFTLLTNLCSAYLQLGQLIAARKIIDDLNDIKKKSAIEFNTLKILTAICKDQQVRAQRLLPAVEKLLNDVTQNTSLPEIYTKIATCNLAYMEDRKPRSGPCIVKELKTERLEEFNDKFGKGSIVIPLIESRELSLQLQQFSQSKHIEGRIGGKSIFIGLTSSIRLKDFQHIGKGSRFKEIKAIIDNRGLATRLFPYKGGSFFIVDRLGLIFRLNEADVVVEWAYLSA